VYNIGLMYDPVNDYFIDCEIIILDSGLPGCDCVSGFVARDVTKVSKKTRLSAS